MTTTHAPSFLILLVTAYLTLTVPVFAGDGNLDLNFDSDGKVSVQVSAGFDDGTQDLTVLLDGSVLLAGYLHHNADDADFSIIKLTRQGQLDPTFGSSGQARVAFDLGGGWADYGAAIAIQPDGKIVVAGYVETNSTGNFDFAVARLNPDGYLDPSFGSAGKVTVAWDLGGNHFDSAEDVLIQPDGKIVVVGTADRGQGDTDMVIVRLLANGSLDTSFGIQGKAVTFFDLGGLKRDQVSAALLQPDGKIVLVGTVEKSNLAFDFAAARLLANGLLDTGFGAGGKTVVSFDRGGANQDFAWAATLDRFGRIVMAGQSNGSTQSELDFAIARLQTNGLLDSSFSTDGKVTVGIDQGLGGDRATAVAIAPNDKLVVTGTAWLSSGDADFAAIRLHDNGTLDTQFGSNGRSLVAFDLGSQKLDQAQAMAIGIDGAIVLAGTADGAQNVTVNTVARLHGAPWFVVHP